MSYTKFAPWNPPTRICANRNGFDARVSSWGSDGGASTGFGSGCS